MAEVLSIFELMAAVNTVITPLACRIQMNNLLLYFNNQNRAMPTIGAEAIFNLPPSPVSVRSLMAL